MSDMDNKPPSVGGRHNSWRELSLEIVPRQAVIDVFEYLKEYGRASVTSVQPSPYGPSVRRTASTRTSNLVSRGNVASRSPVKSSPLTKTYDSPANYSSEGRPTQEMESHAAAFSTPSESGISSPPITEQWREPTVDSTAESVIESADLDVERSFQHITTGKSIVQEANKYLKHQQKPVLRKTPHQSPAMRAYSSGKTTSRGGQMPAPSSSYFADHVRYVDVGNVIAPVAPKIAKVQKKKVDHVHNRQLQTRTLPPIPKPATVVKRGSREELLIKSDLEDTEVKIIPIYAEM